MKNTVVLVAKRDFGGGVEQKVLLTLDNGVLYNMFDLLTSIDKFLNVICDCPMKIDTLNGLPVVVLDESAVGARSSDIAEYSLTAIESALVVKGLAKEDVWKAIQTRMNDWYPRASEEHLKFFIDFVGQQYKQYCEKKLSVKIEYRTSLLDPVRTQETRDAINQMNLSVSLTAKYVSPGQNVLIKQESPVDRFFIPLPKYEEFKGGTLFSQDIVPDIRDVFTPFLHSAYYSPLWRSLTNRSASQRHQVLIQWNQGRQVAKVSSKEMDNWVEYPEGHVLGNPENDNLPIMDNEREWYNAFLEFIRVDLVESYGEKVAGEMFATGGLSPDMEAFYDSLLESVLQENWSCAGQFEISNYGNTSEDDDDDDDGRGKSDDRNDDKNVPTLLYYAETNPNCFDGMEAIKGFIKRVARGNSGVNPNGCGTYAEALVKLARWGERKPANLKLDGESLVFSLTRFSVESKGVEFAKMDVKLINGRPLSVIGFVRLTWLLQDMAYREKHKISGKISDVPVGLIAIKSFEGEHELSQVVYLSLLDVISEYVSGNRFINGVDIGSDGKFRVDLPPVDGYSEELSLVMANLSKEQDSTQFISKRLEDVARDIGQKAFALTDLVALAHASTAVGGAVTTWCEKLLLENKNDLAQIQANRELPVLRAMQFRILKHILPLYFKYSDLVRDKNLEPDFAFGHYLDAFYDLSETLSVRSSTEFYSTGEVRTTNMAARLEAFGADKKDEPAKPEEKADVVPEVAIAGDGDRYVFENTKLITSVYPIKYTMKSKSSGEPISIVAAYYGSAIINVNGKPSQVGVIFAESELLPDMKRLDRTYDFSIFSMHFLRIIGEMQENTDPVQKPIMFASTTTVRKVLHSLMNRG